MDLAFRNASVIDGTGAPRFQGDVGIKGDRIVAVGQLEGRARQEIDVEGAAIAPGFIDCHTHYDAQVMWDEMLSPSVYHGVTTVLAGNCGFTLAPLSGREADTDYLLSMLSRVEGMPLGALRAAVKPTWKSFGEYLDAIDGRLAINTSFLVGHSALRRHVMGERAVGEPATPDEVEAMAELLRRSLAEGGTGFSTSISLSHFDHNGDPVPSRWASDEEILTLATVLREFPGTWLEILPGDGPIGERTYKLASDLSLASQRPVNWNLVVVDAAHAGLLEAQKAMGRYAAERGAKVLGLVPAVPIKTIVNLRTGVQFDMLSGGWNDFLHLPDAEKLAAMRDPAARKRLQQDMEATTQLTGLPKDFGEFRIEDVRSESNARWKGRLVREYAAEAGLDSFDALFQLAAEEELWLSVSTPEIGGDAESWSLRGDVWRDDHCILGGSDAGAHLDALNTFALSTQLLGEGVRRRGLLTLEEGVQSITSTLADAFGLRGRGRIAPGAVADLVVFDPDRIDCGPIELRADLPDGESRLYADAVGVEHVVVGGVPVARDNQPTGRKGGRVLRAGRDTETVPLR